MRLEYANLSETPPFVNLHTKNRRSNEFLLMAKSHLLDNFDKVVQHQCITFKEVNCKESFCIPDFICGNETKVIIIDAKVIPTTQKKMMQYRMLLEFIMSKNKDYRTIETMTIEEALPYQPFF